MFPFLGDKAWFPVVFVIVGTVSSIFSYHYIEQPCRKWMRQLLVGSKLYGTTKSF